MFRILSASKDTYITNRIIRNSFRASDANTGQAGTLDLFKLADESTFTSEGPFNVGTTDEPIELSRLLLQFDMGILKALTSSILDLDHSSFNCTLQLFDVLGGQTLPSNFKLILYPLSKSFDEGVGRDVIAFEDIDVANFVTASYSGDTVVTWSQSGANDLGYLGQESIDVFTSSADLGDLFVVQTFADGNEDLSMDVTTLVSATLTQQIPDCGFRISFSGTQETDDRTRFVKRFVSRHSTNTRLRPRIIAKFDDSIQDHSRNFEFDVSGTLFLNNFHRGQPANIVSGSTLTEITGASSLYVMLKSGSDSGSYTKSILAGQHKVGNNFITGVYSASFAIPSNAALLSGSIINYGSATFDVDWKSLDENVPFLSSSIVIRSPNRTALNHTPERLKVSITNLRESYKTTERVRFRVFVQDEGYDFTFTKSPVEMPSRIFDKMYYRIVDTCCNEIVVPFDTATNSTRLSTDSEGMFFDVFMSDLDVGKMYAFDLLVNDAGVQQIFEQVVGSFRIDP